MSTNTSTGQKSSGTKRSTEPTTIPDRSGLIGIDAEGARHYLGNRVTHDGVPVYVKETDGSIEEWDLTETPCTQCDDVVEGWIDHVERKRGEWRRVVYNQPLAMTLVEAVEEGDD